MDANNFTYETNTKGLVRIVMLSCIACTGAFMWGYDSGVIGGVLSLGSFRNEFGIPTGTSKADKARQASISSNCVSILQAGGFFGALLISPLCDRLGRKWAIAVAAIVFTIGAVLQVAAGQAGGLGVFYTGRIISGLGVGAASMVVPTYVSEMSPKHVRGKVVGLWQFFIVTGVTISYWIDYAVNLRVSKTTNAQWRIPVGIQIVPSVVLLLAVIILKESPRWLAKKDRPEEAVKVLAYMRGLSANHPAVQAEMAEIIASTEHEREVSGGAKFTELWLPGNRKRVAIGFVLMMCQQFSGTNAIGYYAPSIFQAVGVASTSTGLFATGLYGVIKMIMTMLLCLFAIERLGRRLSLVIGAFVMGTFMLLIGSVLKTHPPVTTSTNISGASYAMIVFIYLYVTAYCFSWGPVPWIYASEIYPNRLREYCVAICASSQWLWNFVVTQFSPYALVNLGKNPAGWGVFILFACFNFCNMAFAWFLPETTNKTLEEMDAVFGVSTAIDTDKIRSQAYSRYDNNPEEMNMHTAGYTGKDDVKDEVTHVERA